MSPSNINEKDETSLRIVAAQLNFHVGNIPYNLEKHIKAANHARDELNADIIVFPELSLSGYPAEDLLLRDDFLKSISDALQTFIKTIRDIHCLISYPLKTEDGLKNACSLIYNGEIIATYFKMCLPNYGVFDENRYFTKGKEPCVVTIKNIPIGIVICEDLWFKTPVELAISKGAKLILSPNASPFELDKQQKRERVLSKRASQNHVPIVYVNCVGGQDDLVFDGGSMAIDAKGSISASAPYFKESLLPINMTFANNHSSIEKISMQPLLSNEEKTYQALVLSLRDYIEKNHFKGVLIGVSGGIDSALTLAIAVDALGKDRVQGIIMPSRHTSEISMTDALEIIHNLNVSHHVISIEPTYEALLTSLKSQFANTKVDKTEENIQARARAMILMALSNKFGYLVLTTGNRSEMAVGYCTLYGDMAGGFAILKDVPKTLVYALANYRNELTSVIPKRTIDRAPSAELAPNQKDQDSLPPYSILDEILYYYLNLGESIENITARGFAIDDVKKVIQLVQNSEYKRRQAAIGPRINNKSFGRDWRYPITDGFKV